MKTRMPELRARHGLTQAELAKQVGVQRETIVHLERGRYNPSLRLAWRISRALHTTIEDVFTFEDEEGETGGKG